MYLKKQIFLFFPMPSELSEDSSALRYFFILFFFNFFLLQGLI